MRTRKKEGGRRINEEGEDDRLLKADAVNEGDSERDRAILGGVVELRELVMAAFGSCGGDLEFGRLGFPEAQGEDKTTAGCLRLRNRLTVDGRVRGRAGMPQVDYERDGVPARRSPAGWGGV